MTQPPYAVFFVSTGRSGTQWLASSLAAHYADLAEVRHEPMQIDYSPRALFQLRSASPGGPLPPMVAAHLQHIRDVIAKTKYIECGWPVYGALPAYLRRLRGRTKVVHLTRCPAHAAASLTTHRIYQRGAWTDAMVPVAGDAGIVQSDVDQATWSQMTEFEKNVFWWAELHSFALTLKKAHPDLPWLTVRYEDLLCVPDPRVLHELLDFLELPPRDDFMAARTRRVDGHSLQTPLPLNVDAVARNSVAVGLMAKFGYRIDADVRASVALRYPEARSGL